MPLRAECKSRPASRHGPGVTADRSVTVTRTVSPGARRPSAPGQGAPSQLSLKNTGRQAYVPHRDAEGTGISIESLSQVGWTELEEQPGVTGYQRFWPGLLAGPGPGLGPGPFRTTYFLSEG